MTWRVGFVALSLTLAALFSHPARGQSGRAWLNGFVFDGSPTRGLGGARVELTGDPGWERLRDVHLATAADDDGRYALRDVPYGLYRFRVSAPGRKAYEIPLYVAPDMLTQIHVMLEKGPPTGPREP